MPIASRRYPCSFFHGYLSVMSKCFTNIPQLIHSLTDYRMRKHYYPCKAGNKETYTKPQKTTAGPGWEAWEHTGIPVDPSTSPDYWSLPEVGGGSHCSSLTIHTQHQKARWRYNINKKAHIFPVYSHAMFWVVLGSVQGYHHRDRDTGYSQQPCV